MLQRKTPLGRGKPLARTGRLPSVTPLRRGGPIRAVSSKRQAENAERRRMARERFPDGPPRCVVPWCPRMADSLHEILSRARGGSITDPENTVPACNPCNDELTLEPAWGYELGLIKHSGLCCQGRAVCSRYAKDGAA